MGWRSDGKAIQHIDDAWKFSKLWRDLILVSVMYAVLCTVVCEISRTGKSSGIGASLILSILAMLPGVAIAAGMIWRGQARPASRDFVLRFMPLVFGLYFVAALHVLSVVVSPSRVLRYGIMTTGIVLPVLCSAAMQMFYRRRSGTSLHCSQCEYEKSPGAGPQCPECGSVWDDETRVVRGRTMDTRGYVVAGLVILTAAMGMLLTTMLNSTFRDALNRIVLNSAVSNERLIHDLEQQRYWSVENWEYLVERTLSDEEFESVYKLVGNQFDEAGKSSTNVGDCLGPLLASQKLSDARISRLISLAVKVYADQIEDAEQQSRKRVLTVFDLGLRRIRSSGRNEGLQFFVYPPRHSCSSARTRMSHYRPGTSQATEGPLELIRAPVVIELSPCDASNDEIASWNIPIMIVGTNTSATLDPGSIGADGSFVPPAGALWSRVVRVPVKVEQEEKK